MAILKIKGNDPKKDFPKRAEPGSHFYPTEAEPSVPVLMFFRGQAWIARYFYGFSEWILDGSKGQRTEDLEYWLPIFNDGDLVFFEPYEDILSPEEIKKVRTFNGKR